MQFVVDTVHWTVLEVKYKWHFVLFTGHDEAKIQMFGSRKIIINVIQLRYTVASGET